ncbi:acyl carrier protein [Williamsia sp. CHRR-6]|uniref:acyl carrier protein n=1 Tax=Williamsia sp. CHRR-6 TaxID=2835871 RepID=UPI001BDAAB8C|nr:phosphopantetheine-binding protein [Williamsia sp. CHRR-6]MBT0566021.1 hypothetical protein [Williamsia sp. CHRR-6]
MSSPTPHTVTEEAVFADVKQLIAQVLEEYGVDDVEIEMETRFHEDLELESIDLVTMNGLLREKYGTRVNFAEFIAALDLEEILGLTVGDLVAYSVRALSEPVNP